MNGHSGAFGYFWLHRLHSLAGLILGAAFLLCFLVPYSSIFDGAEAFNRTMALAAAAPVRGAFLLLFVAVPLVFHGLAGVLFLSTSSVSVLSYGFYQNWMYLAQRVAGLVLVPFVGYHAFATTLVAIFGHRAVDEGMIHRMLASTSMRAFYAIGIVCLAFYVGNGFSLAAKAWGITASRRSRGAASIAGWVMALVGAAWGVRIVLAF